jgi:ribosome maturation factor RimP
MDMATIDQVRDAAAPLLAAAGFELWDVEMSGDAIVFLVDRPGGVDLDGCAAASHLLSPLLDEREELVPAGRYELQVSSPGVERVLRTPDQYRRYVGTPVNVKTAVAIDGARRFYGTLTAAGPDNFTLAPDDGGEPCSLRYDQVDRTRTVLVWGAGRPPRPPAKAARRSGAALSGSGSPDPKDHTR